MFLKKIGCWLLPGKFSFCPKNNGFARPLARMRMVRGDLVSYVYIARLSHAYLCVS